VAERTADIERGRDAARREAWAEAYDELAAADPQRIRVLDASLEPDRVLTLALKALCDLDSQRS